ncbi:MAG TPA: mRNA surveillance protein Pelota [Nitrososphaeraceae archaeon]|nr:mRNA surveillance protein Pelota [Nitrososphaeraceae archaeon]
MITKEVKGSSGKAIIAIPDDADDLLSMRRIIQPGDDVTADTTRVIKQVKEYARPDKGNRVNVRLSINVENISLDDVVGRLRLSGTITNSSNELVPRGIHHSLTVELGDMIVIDKHRKWKDTEIGILKKSTNNVGFILLAVDTQEAAVASVLGTHLHVIPNIYSGQSGKRYEQSVKNNTSIDVFFGEIVKTIFSISRTTVENNHQGQRRMIIFGPGETKRRLYNSLVAKHQFNKELISVVDGVDVAGEDGIFVFLRSPAMKESMHSSKLATVSSILDEIMRLVHKGEIKYSMGMEEVSDATSNNAVECLVFSDSIFKTVEENSVIKLLNSAEAQGAKIFAVDSSTDIGLRVSSLGGIIALLRYAIHLRSSR